MTKRTKQEFKDYLHDPKTLKWFSHFIVMDINNFKMVNDTYGHLAGDQVLETIESVLDTLTEDKTVIYTNWGGDEFVAAVGLETDQSVKELFLHLNNMIKNVVATALGISHVSLAVGITPIKEVDSFEAAFTRAEAVMSIAKSTSDYVRLEVRPGAVTDEAEPTGDPRVRGLEGTRVRALFGFVTGQLKREHGPEHHLAIMEAAREVFDNRDVLSLSVSDLIYRITDQALIDCYDSTADIR